MAELSYKDESLWDERRLDHDAMLKHISEHLKRHMYSALSNAGVARNCLTCNQFVEPMETCTLLNERPPARVIAYGCEKHSETIPF